MNLCKRNIEYDSVSEGNRKMREKEYVDCNICKKSNYINIAQIDSCNIVQCRECGLFYVNPKLKIDDADEIYSERYYPKQDPLKESKINLKNILVRSYFARINRIKLSYLTRFGKSGKLLDLGCGAGEFLCVAHTKGWDTYGADVSLYASERARARGLNVTPGTMKEAKFANSFFDVVTLFDVFSHLSDPLEEFAEISAVLKDDGTFIFATGDYSLLPDYLYATRWGPVEEHYWKLNDSSMELLLKKSGFSVIERRINPYGVLTASPKALFDRGVPKRIINVLLFGFTSVISDEVLVVCKKAEFTTRR
jgi:SAM-dependent methyltransferase